MNHTRTGKIARLPKAVREVLSDRLEQGETAAELLAWLNGLACVQAALAENFGGRPITEQNLSDWRAGGHQDWLQHEQARLLVAELTERNGDLTQAAHQEDISDHLAQRLAVELIRLSQLLLESEPDPVKRWERACSVNRELSRLRRDNHRAALLRLDARRLALEENEPRLDKMNRQGHEERTRRISPHQSQLVLADLECAQYRRSRPASENHPTQAIPHPEPQAPCPEPVPSPLAPNPAPSCLPTPPEDASPADSQVTPTPAESPESPESPESIKSTPPNQSNPEPTPEIAPHPAKSRPSRRPKPLSPDQTTPLEP